MPTASKWPKLQHAGICDTYNANLTSAVTHFCPFYADLCSIIVSFIVNVDAVRNSVNHQNRIICEQVT